MNSIPTINYFVTAGGREFWIILRIVNEETNLAEVLVKSESFTARDKYAININSVSKLKEAFKEKEGQVSTKEVAEKVRELLWKDMPKMRMPAPLVLAK